MGRKKILVTGGCGYIGSHTIVDLIENDFQVISIDNYVRSSNTVLEGILKTTGQQVQNYAVDLCLFEEVKAIFEENTDIQGVIHFAAYKSVPESVEHPLMYYKNNLNSLLNILECIKLFNIPYFIFSSSCSVYGNIKTLPVVEATPLGKAQCPYAETKQMGEQMVEAFSKKNGSIQSILLRYFNPGGAHPDGQMGEVPQKGAYNVIPILMETALGIRPKFTAYGKDYPTRDGTCIRDYIHVMDVGNAHTKALQYLMQKKENDNNCEVFNVGIGEGVTVLELIQALEEATQKPLNYELGDRRAGDVAAIYADSKKAQQFLKWKPQYTVQDILSTAWAWEQKRREML